MLVYFSAFFSDSNVHLKSLMDVLGDLFESCCGIGPLHPLSYIVKEG
jgi:hypothetical protein